ncbi:MAG: RNA 2',3'-cyclic phosphodiesterase [Sphaerochaeta sp.]
MRLFYALLFDEDTLDACTEIQHSIESYLRKGNATMKSNMHVTLAFLGEQNRSDLPLFELILASLPSKEIKLSFDHIDSFPKQGGDIIYLGVAYQDALFQLQKTLVAMLQTQHVVFKDTHFKAHITLYRRARFESLPAIKPFKKRATQIALMQSHRVDGVLTYTPLFSKPI